MNEMELTVDRIAVGGKAIGLDDSGRVTFVSGAVPTERVRVAVTKQSKRFAEAVVIEVLDPSPDRAIPPCPYVTGEPRCGGCDWQHITPDAQRRLRVAIVEDALRRIGKLDTTTIAITSGTPLPTQGYRTTVRMLVDNDGRLAYRQPQSHAPFRPDTCLVAHPAVNDLIQNARFHGAREVTVRVGAVTGDRMVEVSGRAADVPADVRVAKSVVKTGSRSADPPAAITERVGAVDLRVSAGAFFQSSHVGAEALVDAVRSALNDIEPDGILVDAYAGGGLFAATLGADWLAGGGSQVIAIESNPRAVADLRLNVPATAVQKVEADVEQWKPIPAKVIIADPARTGLEAGGVARLVSTGADRIVLISCDAGALGRDALLLTAAGYSLTECTVLDLFNHTSHVEVVSRFTKVSVPEQ
ncbi:MAG: class I SAM-dependent RNA methyltransferase [Acidimicrobiales bacterium]|nr:class I SAM-dependent RNA methyltransferase [Acidimicrobiales bacterium]